ncbi:MAG TPA: hypothetical protein PKI92_03430 [Candidatus Woesebacteria bacterium]|nr:hypothetical protein [Candidatus Woesebacteria bacterium]
MELREQQGKEFVMKQDLPKSLSVEKIPMENRPNFDDWKELQGGIPDLEPFMKDRFGRILSYNVVHNYENLKDPSGTGAVVVTPLFTAEKWDENPYVYRKNGNREVAFPVALVWACHGKPCEIKSGGRDKYPRRKVTK